MMINIIVIAVIAILSAVLIPTFGGIVENAKDTAAAQEARNLYTVYLADKADEGNVDEELYVVVEGGCVHIVDGAVKKTGDKYITSLPTSGTYDKLTVSATDPGYTYETVTVSAQNQGE